MHGLAPEGWLAAPSKRPLGQPAPLCAIEPADSVDRKKTPQGKRLRPRFAEGDKLPHMFPLTLDRGPFVCLQLRTGWEL
jgi:hypothetical protein